jgi:hypothetical protein
MEEQVRKKYTVRGGEKEIVFSKAIKAGQRIYYLDVKKNIKNELFIAITESKRNQFKEGEAMTFEKHKIFLYREDFEKFMEGMNEVIRFITTEQQIEVPKEKKEVTEE